MSRLVKGILIYLFLTLGVSAFNYNDTWFNKNASIPKIVIKNDGTIQAYGKCVPNNCDWGTTTYTKIRAGILASWSLNNVHNILLIEAVGRNRVRVVAKSLYCNGNSGLTEVFFLKRLPNNVSINNSSKFVGNWRNENPNTKSLTQISISDNGGKVYVHIWGKCHPNDCDWGTKEGFFTGKLLRVNWNQGFVNREIIIRGVGYSNGKYNRIQVKIISRYNDNRGIKEETEYLIRD